MTLDSYLAYGILVLAGLLLLIVELFLPGGLLGIIGLLSIICAMGVGFVIFPSPWGFFSALGIIIFCSIAFILWIQLFPRSRLGNRIILSSSGADQKSSLPPAPDLIGQTGETVTALRPAGVAMFNGKRHDVLADGGQWLEAGRSVIIKKISDGHLIVALPPES